MKSSISIFPRNTKIHYLLVALVAVAVMLPIFFEGIPYGYDLPHHFQCAYSYYEGIISGDFYPSWSAVRNYGFGGMELRLYPPISHYSLAVFYLISQNWHLAAWLTITFYSILGSLGVYFWARQMMPSSQAVFAGCVYALMPYHLNQIYNTFFYAEYVGSAILPFSFLFIHRICKRGQISDTIGLAISFAALILTHLPLTVIGAICFSIYAISLLEREKFISQIVRLSAGVALGLAASSFFWLKVLQERDLLAKTLIYPDPWLDFNLHFLLTPVQTFAGELPTRIYETATFFYDLMFLCAVLLTIFLTVPLMIRSKEKLTNLRGVWLVFLASVFLCIPVSRFVWNSLPILQEVQFPWRWLAVVSLSGAVLSASRLNILIEWFQNNKRPFALIIAGSIFAFTTFSVSQIIRQAPFIPDAKSIEAVQNDQGFTFWWTIWAREEIFKNREKVSVVNRPVEIQNWQPTSREFQISPGEAEFARIATFYHPNWQAAVNGIPADIKPDENGAILIPISNQNSNVELSFRETLTVGIGRWISTGVWLCFFICGLFYAFGKIQTAKRSRPVAPHSIQTDFWNLISRIYLLTEKNYAILIVAGIAVLTLMPMIVFGIFNGGDLYQHMQFAATFKNSIGNGDFYPSWGGFENDGYGSVGVRFYPPAVPFLLGLMHLLTGNWQIASSVVFLIFTLIGSFGVYLWAREYLPSAKAIWAAIFFIVMPYHLIEIHNASMYAEFAGVSVLPFSFVYLTRICRDGKYADVLGLAASYGLLILTHLPSTVIVSLSLFGYAMLLLSKKNWLSTILKLAAAVGLGVCASSIYWSKMVFERDWLRNTKFWQDEHFNYNINFLLTSPWVDTRQLWFFNFVLITMLLFVGGCAVAIYYKQRPTDKISLRGLFGLFFGALFMTTILSQPIWAILPYLHEVQFPWRWLTVASVVGAVLAAVGLDALSRLAKDSNWWNKAVKGFILLIAFLFLSIYGLIWVGFQLNYIPANKYESWVTEKSTGMGAEWFWTTETKAEAFDVREKILAGARTTEIISWMPEERVFNVDSGEQVDARIATLFYPHWKATVNGVETAVKMSSDGTILIPLNTEKSKVRVWFEEPIRVKAAWYVSIITWFCLFLGLVFCLRKKTHLDKLNQI